MGLSYCLAFSLLVFIKNEKPIIHHYYISKYHIASRSFPILLRSQSKHNYSIYDATSISVNHSTLSPPMQESAGHYEQQERPNAP